MFSTRLDSLLPGIRRHVCPKGPPDADGYYDGILFNLSLRLSHKNRELWYLAKVLFAGASVFCDVDRHKGVCDGKNNWRFWSHTCHHESCWASDGLRFLSDLYFEMAAEVNPDVPPAEMNDFSGFGSFGLDPWSLVKVKLELDPGDPHRHRRRIADLFRKA